MTDAERTNVCIVISNLELGGAERQVVQIANGLDKAIFNVLVVSLAESNPLADQLMPDVEFVVIPRRTRFAIGQLRSLRKAILRFRPNAIHAFLRDADLLTRVLGKLSGVPLVIGSERNSDYQVSTLMRLIGKLTSPLLDLCVANSYAGANYHQLLYGMAPSRYRVVENGVDTDRFQPVSAETRSELRQRYGIDSDAIVVGVFASMKEQKNHLMLVRAAEHLESTLPGVQYLFVGGELEAGQRQTTEYAKRLADAIDKSPLKGQFHLLGKRSDVEKLYCCCDATALPSWYEGLPNVVLESVACGVPVVATAVSDNERIISGFGFGTTVPPNDDRMMAKALYDVLSNRCAPCDIPNLTTVRESISRAAMIKKISAIYLSADRQRRS